MIVWQTDEHEFGHGSGALELVQILDEFCGAKLVGNIEIPANGIFLDVRPEGSDGRAAADVDLAGVIGEIAVEIEEIEMFVRWILDLPAGDSNREFTVIAE